MLHAEAGASGIWEEGTTFSIPRDVRISFLILDSIVVDGARIIDTRDNDLTICASNSPGHFCDVDSLKRLAGEELKSCDAPSRGLVINWLTDDL